MGCGSCWGMSLWEIRKGFSEDWIFGCCLKKSRRVRVVETGFLGREQCIQKLLWPNGVGLNSQ